MPLSLGVGALLCYWFTANEFFVQVGLICVTVGAIAALAGTILVILTYSFSVRVVSDWRETIRWRAKLALAGVVLNFPIAFVCMTVGLVLVQRTLFEVRNEGAEPVQSVVLDIGTERIDIGDLAAGESWSTWRRGTDPVAVEWEVAGTRHRQQLATYIQDGGGEVGVSLKGDRLVQD
jgi:hypothetical protein